jgi:NAD(P)-dependent dehydrogenase (short-subunit alcohol dehydrogenase family)
MGRTVLITGASGNIGAALTTELLRGPAPHRLVCVSRAPLPGGDQLGVTFLQVDIYVRA